MNLDIAIVGGGVAGAYSAWRLQQESGAKQSIGLFEYSNRIGGRLYTLTLPGVPHVKAEVGGMRYIPVRHYRCQFGGSPQTRNQRLSHGRASSRRSQLQFVVSQRQT